MSTKNSATLESRARQAAAGDGDHYAWLDWLRFGAAFAVLLCHARGGTWMDYGSLDAGSKNLIAAMFFAVTRPNLEPVVVFFVLSGFLVGGVSLARSRQGMPSGASAACRDLPERSTPYPDVSTKACLPRSQGRK